MGCRESKILRAEKDLQLMSTLPPYTSKLQELGQLSWDYEQGRELCSRETDTCPGSSDTMPPASHRDLPQHVPTLPPKDPGDHDLG